MGELIGRARALPPSPSVRPSARAADRFRPFRTPGAGADWVILQPPAIKGASENRPDPIVRQRGPTPSTCRSRCETNPVNLEVFAVSHGAGRAEPPAPEQLRSSRVEGWVHRHRALRNRRVRWPLFGHGRGHGGIEFPASSAIGGRGLIPAPDFLAAQGPHLRLLARRLRGPPRARRPGQSIGRILPGHRIHVSIFAGHALLGKRLFAATGWHGGVATTAGQPLKPTESGWRGCSPPRRKSPAP